MKNNKLVDFGTNLSIVIYFFSAIAKIIIGKIGFSNALFTDGLNSLSDVLSTLLLAIGLKISRKPRDKDHHYGHYRVEHISMLISSFIMVIIGFEALTNAVKNIFDKSTEAPSMLTAVVAGASLLLMLISAAINYAIAKKTNVAASRAVMKNNLSDAVTSIGVSVAIVTAKYNLQIVDIIISLIIAAIIIYTGVSIFWEASLNLSDGFEPKQIELYTNVAKQIDGVEKVLDIQGRMLGNNELVDITIAVDGSLTVSQSHEIADRIEYTLEDDYHLYHVHVHIEPYINELS